MERAPDAPVTFEEMKGEIGSLLFLWSRVERELRTSLDDLGDGARPAPHGIARSLALWSEDIDSRTGGRPLVAGMKGALMTHLNAALTVRNLVCHGLIGIAAQTPAGRTSAGTEAHLTLELGQERRRIGWEELRDLLDGLERATGLIRDLTTAALQGDPAGDEALHRTWKTFPHRD